MDVVKQETLTQSKGEIIIFMTADSFFQNF